MTAWVRGDAVGHEAAVDAAAVLLTGARVPVVSGLGACVGAIRAACRLADRLGASLDPAGGDALYAELAALSAGGALTTTLAETLGRADAVLVVGQRPWRGDLVRELAGTRPVRGRAAGSERIVLSLGGPGNGESRHIAYGTGSGGLLPALAHLRAFARGNLAGEAALADLAQRLAGGRYGVCLYEPGEVGALGVEALQGLARDLAERTRFFTLPLGDGTQSRAVTQLCAWTTGQPPRVGFGRHRPEHDPWRFDGARQIREREADAVLWLSALPAPRPDWLGSLPTVAVVGQGSAEARPETAEVVIAVGVPGATVGGALWNERRGVISYAEGDGSGAVAAPEVLAGMLARIEGAARC